MGTRRKSRRQSQALPGGGSARGRVSVLACAALSVTLGVPVAMTSTGAAHANGVPAPVDCPTPTPIESVVEGVNGTGWTVSHGTDPETFSATIIGRVTDGIAPGVDLILARVSSPALTAAGGVWSGISGSPVYADDGTLIGSVSYSLASNSMIAGLTPAAALLTVLDADPDDPAAPGASKPGASKKVSIPKAALPKLLATGALTAAQAAKGFTQLPVPLTVGTVAATSASRWAKRLSNRLGVPVMTGARASSTALAPAGSIVGGSNFAGMLSYGYVSMGAIGTTSLTCQGRAVGFGHPFLDTGVDNYSLQAATTVTIADDPLFGPFKVVNIGGIAGSVDRDRTLGLRGLIGTVAANTTVIQSSIARTETGAQTGGTTYAVNSDLVADAAAFHALANVDKVMGSSSSKGNFNGTLSVTGTRANGAPFILTLGNTFTNAGGYPLDYAVGDWVYWTLRGILDQEFEDVKLTQITLTGQATSSAAAWRGGISRVKQGAKFVNPNGRALGATAGTPLPWKVGFTKVKSTVSQWREGAVTPPLSAKGTSGTIYVKTADNYNAGVPTTFSELLTSLQSAPRNDEVRLELRGPDSETVLASTTLRFNGVVGGIDMSYRAIIR
jgi:hypothetical protein